jgi:hypothetical protein
VRIGEEQTKDCCRLRECLECIVRGLWIYNLRRPRAWRTHKHRAGVPGLFLCATLAVPITLDPMRYLVVFFGVPTLFLHIRNLLTVLCYVGRLEPRGYLVEMKGIEPSTFALRTRRSPS